MTISRRVSIGIVEPFDLLGETAVEVLFDKLLADGGLEQNIGFDLRAFDSKVNLGKALRAGHHGLPRQVLCELLETERLCACDVVLFACDAETSLRLIPPVAERGVLCIDLSNAFARHENVLALAPQVSSSATSSGFELMSRSLEALDGKTPTIIVSPCASVLALTMALAPLKQVFGLRRVVVSTYQSVSGVGKRGVDLLLDETRDFLSSQNPEQLRTSSVFPKIMAFNVIPTCELAEEPGSSALDESDMIVLTKRILRDAALHMAVTCVRVPVFIADAQAVTIELERSVALSELCELFASLPGLELSKGPSSKDEDDDGNQEAIALFPTPREVHGKEEVYIGRIREVGAFAAGHGFSFWLVSDNLRAGAALNAVQIVKQAVQSGFLSQLREIRNRKGF